MKGVAHPSLPVMVTLGSRWTAKKRSLAYLDLLPNSSNSRGQGIEFASKTMPNGKPDLGDKSGGTMTLNTHTRKLAREAVLVSQEDDLWPQKQDVYISRSTL